MKKIVLITVVFLQVCAAAMAQTANPVSTAHIMGLDGKAELIFDEPITENFTVDVLDLTGKVMFTLRHNCETEPCDAIILPVESLRKGIYLVQVISAGGKTKTLKLQRN